MSDARHPRPTAELFPESLQLSTKQRELLDLLQTFPGGARSSDLATVLGMHVNTVRGHLDELIARGAVHATTAPAVGRGRPSLIFQVRVPDNRAIAREYISLVEVLAEMVVGEESPSPEAMDKAREIGRAWARRMSDSGAGVETIQDALDVLTARLRELGFDPALLAVDDSDHVDIHLQACPFVTDQGRPSLVVCAMHEGFLQESMGSAPVTLNLRPFHPAGMCTVVSRPEAV
ncbi:helix-turn-helix transcriptional regulator [Corynebacterium nasicanis]|uniref:Helix-turn-helix transcriptional regulator n=1 Tax=Corynebacterium nasicanis TaxID=1448267 RepID=A0ABW1QCD7_9CORY